jgi:hypothetical protein
MAHTEHYNPRSHSILQTLRKFVLTFMDFGSSTLIWQGALISVKYLDDVFPQLPMKEMIEQLG